ncbi:Major facilitator [Theobroma cacao]|nr:Major facilitator [Theobroma cacao]
MGQQRREVTESLLVRHGHGDLVHTEENIGVVVGGGGSVAASSVTTILALSTFVAACVSFGFGCAIGYSSPTQSSIMEDLGLSMADFSLFGSILNIGAILGAVISGKITDLLGRKLTMWILNIFYISGWLAIAFTKVPWLLDLGRLSLGFTNGISGYLVPIYIAEITPKNLRGRFTAIVQLMTCWGMSSMYVVGSFVSWRTLALIAIIPSILQLPLLSFIPESPRWLANVGRDKELESALLCLRGEKAYISDEATDIKHYVDSLKSISEEGILDVFQKKYVRPLLIVAGMVALLSLGGVNAFTYYSGVIFVSAGISSMIGLIALAAAQTLLGFLGTIFIDKSGRRPLLLVALAGLCFSSFLTGLSFLLKMYKGSFVVAVGIPWLLVAEVCKLFSPLFTHSFISFSAIFIKSLQKELIMHIQPSRVLSQLFPINVKGSAGSICNFISGITGWAVAYYFNLLTKWSSAGTFFIFSAFCCANFILAATMVPETKGRTLEEIQASITHSSQ